MKLATLAVLVGGGALVLAATSSRADTNGGDDMGHDSNRQQRRATIERALDAAGGLTPTQRAFLVITAWGESRWSPSAHNGSVGEREAARRAAANNPSIVAWASSCGVPRSRLESGSWGLFQRLAPYLSNDAVEIWGASDPLACRNADPSASSIAFQIASALETARDLQGYSSWRAAPTLGNLRLGWAAPALMGYLTANADRLAKYRRHAVEAGYQGAVIDASIEPFTASPAQAYARIVQAMGAG